MTMTKKDYEAIAQIIRLSSIVGEEEYRHNTDTKELTNKLADYCEGSNPKFKRDTFLSDCGVVE